MKSHSILSPTSVIAGTAHTGPPYAEEAFNALKRLYLDEGNSLQNDHKLDGGRTADHARPLFDYGNDHGEDYASYINHPKVSENGADFKLLVRCEGEDRSQIGWAIVKRQVARPGGNGDGNGRIDNANGRVNNDGNGEIDDDGNGEIDDHGYDRNNDGNGRDRDGSGVDDNDIGRYEDGNGRDGDGNYIDDDWNRRDNNGPRSFAGGKTIPLLGLVSVVAVSCMLLM